MMNSRCLRLIAITILINCVHTGRLTTEENEERIANCGKEQLTTEKLEKIASGKDGTHFTMPFPTYLVRVLTLEHQENLASGFFISPRHILTSSQSVFNEQRQWLNDTNDQITEKMCTTPKEVSPVYANQIQVIFDDSWECFEKTPCRSGRIKNATLLSLCRPIDTKDAKDKEFKIFFSPMLIELETNHKNIKFPCLADSSTELKPGDVVHAHRWQWYIENGKNLSRPQYLKRTIDEVHKEFIATPEKQYVEKVRGGPLVMHETSNGTLAIGIDATTGYDDEAQNTYYHNIKALEKDICHFTGVCAPTPPPTTTSEKESTTLNPDAQISINPSPSDSAGLSTLKPTMSPSMKSKQSTTPPQRTIDEYEVNPTDILYDEDKRRAEEPDVNNDFFVSADFMTDSNGKSGLYWTVGTLVLVLLV